MQTTAKSINLRDRFPYPYTARDARNWLDMVVDQKPEMNFAIDVAGEAVGGIWLHAATRRWTALCWRLDTGLASSFGDAVLRQKL